MLFEDHFDELAALAYRTAFRIVGSRSEAEEIAQEALLKALVRWNRVERHAAPWVCRVAANEAIGVVRKRRRLLRDVDESPGVAQSVVDRLELQQLLLSLPRRQRDVVVLRYVADLSEVAVSQELGISVGSVKTHAHRALRSLRATIEIPTETKSKAVFDV